jgi:hypothetical protein
MPISTPESLVSVYKEDKDHFEHILLHLFIPAIIKAEFEPIPPMVKGADVIHGEIIKNLETADLVLCDMSSLNPNVFFELGIRTALNRTICLVKDNVTNKIPLDIALLNYHTYSSSLSPWILDKEIDSLSEHLKTTVSKSGSTNSLWTYFGINSRHENIGDTDVLENKMELLTKQVDSLKRQIDEIKPDEKKS